MANGIKNPDDQYFRRLLVAVGVILAVGLLVTAIWLSIRVWLAVFAGILLAVFFRTMANWVSKVTRLSPVWGLTIVLVGLVGLGALGGWLLAQPLTEQFGELSQRLPAAVEQVQQRLTESGWNRFLPKKLPSASEFSGIAGKVAANATAVFGLSVKAITTFFVIIFLGLYLAAAPQVYLDGLVRMFPISKRDRVRDILDQVGLILGRWLLGQMLSMAVVGTLIAVGLAILGVPLALALGVLAGLLNFIPIVGSLLSALPAVLLAFLVSPMHPIYVILVYLVVNTGIESHVLVPLIQRHAVNLPPAVAVIALFLLGEMFGFLGILLAIPIAATLVVLVKTIYMQDVLGEKAGLKARTKAPDAR